MDLDMVRWDEIAPGKAAYVLDHARRGVDHQIALLAGADGRSGQMSAIIMAIALGLFGAAGTLWDAAHPRPAVSFAIGSAVAAAAAILAALSARPIAIPPFTYEPRRIVASDRLRAAPVAELQGAEMVMLQGAHDRIAAVASGKARLFGWALAALIASPVAFAAAWTLQGL